MTEYNEIWRNGNLIGMILMIIILGFYFWERLGPWLTMTWTYFLIRGLMVFENPATPFIKELGMNFDQTAGQAFAQLLLIPLAVILIPDQLFKHWKKFAIAFGFIECFCLLIYGYGAFNARSFDAAFIASVFPLAPAILGVFLIVFIPAAQSAATAFTILISQALAFAYVEKKYRKHLLFACALAIIAGYFFVPQLHGFSSSGRIPAWLRFFTWWFDNADFFTGTGTGTFQWLGPYIDKFQGEMFLQMHNDWLQVFFEGGVIGLFLVVMAYWDLLLRSLKNPDLFRTLIGVGVFALTYHPLRFFPSALFICLLVREIMDEDKYRSLQTTRHELRYFE